MHFDLEISFYTYYTSKHQWSNPDGKASNDYTVLLHLWRLEYYNTSRSRVENWKNSLVVDEDCGNLSSTSS